MTFEEINKTLEQMLAVQRELQEAQLRQIQAMHEHRLELDKQRLESDRQRAELDRQRAESDRQHLESRLEFDRQIQVMLQAFGETRLETEKLLQITNQLIGYSLSNESDHLNFEERLRRIESRHRALESGNPDN